MNQWLLLDGGIIVVMIIALALVVRAFIPTPIPAPPTIADGPLAIHINEIDPSTTGMVLISIENLTTADITIDGARLGEALNGHMRLSDAIGNEWFWADATGETGLPFVRDASCVTWRGVKQVTATVLPSAIVSNLVHFAQALRRRPMPRV